MIKIQWLASIWWQNDHNNAKLQSYRITMNCIDLTTKRSNMFSYFAKHWEQRKTTSDQITMICIDFKSKRTKMLTYVANRSEQRKTTKEIKLQWLASIWLQKDRKCWVTSKTFKTTQYYESDQIIMNCIDMTSKRSKCWVTSKNIQNKAILRKWSNYSELHRFDIKTIKMLSYVAKHSKQS